MLEQASSFLGGGHYTLLRKHMQYTVILRVPTIYVLKQKIEKYAYSCKPQFYYITVGLMGCTLHGHVIVLESLTTILQILSPGLTPASFHAGSPNAAASREIRKNTSFHSVLRPFQDHFSPCGTGESVGRMETGKSREKKHLAQQQNRPWIVSHVSSARLEPTANKAVR